MKGKSTQTEKQSKEQETQKDTVSMTVVISKSAREKLGDAKGILGCKTLDSAVNAVMNVISIKELLNIRLGQISEDESITKVDTIPILDQPTDEPIDIIGSLYGKEEIVMVEFCTKLKVKLGYDEIGQIDALIDADIIKIIDTTKPRISPVGEIPDEMSEWEK